MERPKKESTASPMDQSALYDAVISEFVSLTSDIQKIQDERDASHVHETICKKACQVLEADRALLQQMVFETPEQYSIRVLHNHHLPEEYLEALVGRKHSNSLLLKACKEKEVKVVYPEKDAGIFDREAHQMAGHRTMVVAPLLLKEKPYGGLIFYHPSHKVYGPEKRKIVESFAQIASLALEKARTVKEAKKRESNLARYQRLAHLGRYEWDAAHHELIWSDETYQIFGRSPGEFQPTFKFLLETIHPDDKSVYEWAIHKARREENPIDVKYRILLPDGTARIIHDVAEPVSGEDGEIFGWQGAVNDITEQVQDDRKERTRLKQLEISSYITNASISRQYSKELFKGIIQEIKKVILCEQCEISTLNDQRSFIQTWHRESNEKTTSWPQHNKEFVNWVSREVYSPKRIKNIPDLKKCELNWTSSWVETGLRSMILVPILQDGLCIAHLSLTSKRVSAFTSQNENLLLSTSRNLGSLIRDAMLHQEGMNFAAHQTISKKITEAVSSKLKPEDLFRTIVQEIRRAIPCERCLIAKAEPEKGIFRYLHVESDIEIPQWRDGHGSKIWYERIYEQEGPYRVADYRTIDSPNAQILAESGLRSSIFIPILQDGKCIAHFGLLRKEVDAFTAEEEELLASITTHLGSAIRNAALFKETEKVSHELKSTFETISDPIAVMDNDYTIQRVNLAMAKKYGVSPQELIGRKCYEAFHQSDCPYDNCPHRQVCEQQDVHSMEIEDEYTGQTVIRTGAPVLDQEGDMTGAVLWEANITAQKNTENALKESSRRLSTLIENLPAIVYRATYGGKWHLEYVSAYAEKMTGYSPDYLVGKPFSIYDDLIHKEDKDRVMREVKDALSQKNSFRTQYRLRIWEGSDIWVEEYGRGIYDETENVAAIEGIIFDVTHRVQMENELIKSIETAEAASKAKSEFLSTLSHELRTPLNPVIGFSELLLKSSEDELTQNLVPKIRDSGKHLLAMIEELLDLEQIEKRRMSIKIEPTAINPLIMEIITSWNPRLPENVRLRANLDSNTGSINCDPTRVRQTLDNLIDNAIKYSPNGGTIEVRTQVRTDEFWVCVSDEGIGISPDAQDSIFERFRQIDGGYSRKSEGLGIGLALAKGLVERHGGRIWVESEENKGSVFTIALPMNLSSGTSTFKISHHDNTEVKEDTWSGQKILVVDDEAHVHEFMKLLMRNAAKVKSAYNGEEAIELARRMQPDLILMDLQMPIMDGLDAIRHLKSDPKTQSIPIIAVTAQAMEVDKARALQTGPNGFITKPVDIEALKSEIGRVLGVGA